MLKCFVTQSETKELAEAKAAHEEVRARWTAEKSRLEEAQKKWLSEEAALEAALVCLVQILAPAA